MMDHRFFLAIMVAALLLLVTALGLAMSQPRAPSKVLFRPVRVEANLPIEGVHSEGYLSESSA